MDLDELRALVTIAETGSMLAASERLKLTRTTLRRRLDALEARVGVPLLVRGPSGAELTVAGEGAVVHARRVISESAALIAAARQAGADDEGLLRVGLPVGLPPRAVVTLQQTMRLAHPKLSLSVRLAEDPLALQDDVDLVLHFGERVTSGAWITRVMLHTPEVLVASPAYLATHGTPQHPTALREHALIAWRGPRHDPCQWPLVGGGHVEVSPRAISPDIHQLRLAAAAGEGVLFAPDGGVDEPELPPGSLVRVLPDVVERACALRVVVPETVARAPNVRRLLQRITSYLTEG
jgi:DNA-binding transcriptional LysR family regulator